MTIPHEWLTEANGDKTHVKVNYGDLLKLEEDNCRIGELGRIGIQQEQRIAELEATLARVQELLEGFNEITDGTITVYELREALAGPRGAKEPK